MNELEWRHQTRALAREVEPSRDLWPDIAGRLGPHAAPTRTAGPPSSRRLPWAMAASLAAVSLFAGVLAWRQHAPPPARVATHAVRTAITPWKPRNPHLVGAAIELNVAREQLARAIHRAPDDAYLRTLLKHANQRVRRLRQFPHHAG